MNGPIFEHSNFSLFQIFETAFWMIWLLISIYCRLVSRIVIQECSQHYQHNVWLSTIKHRQPPPVPPHIHSLTLAAMWEPLAKILVISLLPVEQWTSPSSSSLCLLFSPPICYSPHFSLMFTLLFINFHFCLYFNFSWSPSRSSSV